MDKEALTKEAYRIRKALVKGKLVDGCIKCPLVNMDGPWARCTARGERAYMEHPNFIPNECPHLYAPTKWGFSPTQPCSNEYVCVGCTELGKAHKVVDIPGPATGERSMWGGGLPTTLRHCTGCGYEDGPWISADLVGGGW